jgi:membrane protease YdiL (CAAX protease family)
VTPPLPAPIDALHQTARVPWAGMRAVVDVVVIYIGAQIIAAIIAVIATRGGNGLDDVLPVLLVLSPVATFVITWAWISLRYRTSLAALRGARRGDLADVGIGLGIGVACLLGQRLIVFIIAAIANSAGVELPVVQETFRMIAQNPDVAPLLVLTSVVLAPIAEEVVFRGVLFQGLRARSGFWVAALVSAGLFTLAHLGEGGGWLASAVIVSGILPLGVVFAALVERRGTLLVSIVAHATYNAIGVAALILTSGQV